MTNIDATRLAGDAYRTRLAHSVAATPDDKTRLAQEGYQSKLARDSGVGQPDTSEYFKIGEKIGDRYEVSAIHHGAMGVVYGCFDHKTKLPRALKTVRARYAFDKQVLALFESEATVWISLEKHPYIVRAYLVERYKNLPFVITEYVRGPEGMEGDLRGWLGHPRLTLPVAVAMALQIAQGMKHAVGKVPNLVHRDLKPANILVNHDGKAMVTDFGLVQSEQSDAGTPAYMSPEQWRRDVLDMRSDIYAYGCILFEMLTAHRLFPAVLEHEWELAHLGSTPVVLTSLVPELPIEIDLFVRSCLEKDAEARPRNWDDIVAFFAEWYHRLTGKAVVFDFSLLARDAEEWLQASYSLSRLNRHEEVLLACQRALAINQRYSEAWCNMGVSLRILKRYEEAIEAYEKALEIDKTFSEAWNNKGSVLIYLDRYEEAIEACDSAIASDSRNIAPRCNKGVALNRLKRYKEAIQAYDSALAIDPKIAFAWENKAEALYSLKRYEEAVQASDSALAIDPSNANTWFRKGNALAYLDRYEDALEAYDHASSLDSKGAISVMKGWNLLKLCRYEEAIQAYDRVQVLNPNVDVWSNKAEALFNLKRYKEAIEAYDRDLAISPNHVWEWFRKGQAFCALNRTDEAIHAYDRALAINANATNILEARKAAVEAKALTNSTTPKALKPGPYFWRTWLQFWGR